MRSHCNILNKFIHPLTRPIIHVHAFWACFLSEINVERGGESFTPGVCIKAFFCHPNGNHTV